MSVWILRVQPRIIYFWRTAARPSRVWVSKKQRAGVKHNETVCQVRCACVLSAVDGGGSRCSTVGTPHVQLLSVPQLDSIQRTLRILDVRLQHVQSNVKDDVRLRSDIDHVRRLMNENQNALTTIVTVLSSIQEEVRRLSIHAHHQRSTILQIHPPPSTRGQHAPVML